MHLLFINDHADFVGGAERSVADTAALLRLRGVRCSLLYAVDGWTAPAFTRHFDASFPMAAVTRQVRELAPNAVYVHQTGMRVIEELIAPDVVPTPPVARFLHDHSLFCPREHKYTAVRRATCSRTVGLGCLRCGGVSRNGGGALRIRLPGVVRDEIRTHQRLDALIVGSEYLANHAAAHGLDADRVHVLPPFVIPRTTSAPTTVREPGRLLFVGALVPGKGLDLLLQALVQLPSAVTLDVVGGGSHENELRALAADLGVAARVTFRGRLPHEAIDEHYRRAAAVVIPSRSPETFSLVGVEALAHGTPVVAALVGGVGEWLLPDRTGIAYPAGDVTALAAAVRRTLDEPASALAMAECGRLRCAERFAPERHIDGLMRLFGSLGPRATIDTRAA